MRHLPIFILALIPSFLIAGGSCSWDDDVKPLFDDQPALLKHLEATLDFEKVGSAVRLGRHFTNLSGRRMAPYVFLAKPKGVDGEFVFEMVVEAEARYFDENNQEIVSAAFDDALTASAIQEKIIGVSIRTASSEDGVPALTEEEAENLAKTIRGHFNEINLHDHRISAVEFAAEDGPLGGKVVLNRNSATGSMELITVDGQTGDHSGFSESFYFWDGELIFVFRQETQWSFHPQNPNQTIDTVKEERFYFHKGQIFRALRKDYEGGGPENLQKAQREAENKPLQLKGGEAPEFFSRASRLLITRKPADALAIYESVFE